MKRRLWALVAVIALLIAACGGDEGTEDTTATTAGGATTTAAAEPTTTAADGGATTTAAAGGDGDCLVGMSWNNYNEERWAKHDEPAIQAALEAGGCAYTSTDAGSSEEQQIADVENLINQGADVIVILAQNTLAILPAVQAATDQGIPVIAYDRLIEDANTFYVSFDNVLVGQLMAEVVFDLVPTGNYFIIKGNGADANSDFLREGIGSVIDAAAEAGDIVILEEDYTDNWDPSLAQTTTEQWLSAHNNDVQAIVSENDGMATGAAAALDAQGLLGEVVLSGQDADVAALQRVAAGTQAVSVWKDARALGTAAGEAAVQLAGGASLADVEGTSEFTYTNKETQAETVLTSILLTPIPITQDNLQEVVDAEWISAEELCSTGGTVGPCA
ncbi:MAG TPA: substrate-binding domain-containing protein [Acidimicrobiia bacterium]|nr:substrate-binding domain-containing protein [Acidimicrobiia bacterium]